MTLWFKYLGVFVFVFVFIFVLAPNYASCQEEKNSQAAELSRQLLQIREAKTLLKELGYRLSDNDILDKRTQKAIESFEKEHSLLVTGTVDSVLIEVLKEVTDKIKRDQDDWMQAKQKNNSKSYQTYIDSWPDGKFKNLAIKELALATKNEEKAAKEKAKRDKLDERTWRNLKRTLTIKSYQGYLEKFPNGKYRDQALEVIEKLEENRENTLPITITTTPQKAQVQVLYEGITVSKYEPGLRLQPNRYKIKVSKRGYKTHYEPFNLTLENNRLHVTLLPDGVVELLDSFKQIPAGRFMMGCHNAHLWYCYGNTLPTHLVTIEAFELMETEVTWAMFRPCIDAGVCPKLVDRGPKISEKIMSNDDNPIHNVSYREFTEKYIPWLESITGHKFRLPSEAEWEYAARAGTTTRYHWGDELDCHKAHISSGSSAEADCRLVDKATGRLVDVALPVKSFPPNDWGLYDMIGNVAEFTTDCWNSSYEGAPTDGKPWLHGDCKKRVLRGGYWTSWDNGVSLRYFDHVSLLKHNYGFRLARDLDEK